MFSSPNVKALFKKAALKLETDGDGNLKRVAEATFLIDPFPAALAHELGEEIATHLFDEVDEIRPELDAIALRVQVGLQRVSLRRHPDLKPSGVLEPVLIRRCKVERIEDPRNEREWLTLSFVLVFDLAPKPARNVLIEEFGNLVFLTFEAMQGDLLAEERRQPAEAAQAEA